MKDITKHHYLICIFIIAMIVSVITIVFGILYDSATILLNGYSVFFIFGVLSLLLYSLNIVRGTILDIPKEIESIIPDGLIPLIPAFTVSISILPLSLMIIHLLNSARFNVKYNEKDNDELYWSNIAVFFLIITIVFGGIIILDKLGGGRSEENIKSYVIGGNAGLLLLSGACMFIINKMNLYVKLYSTSG